MNAPHDLPPQTTGGGGHTAQYETLAEGLRQAAEAMEADLAYLAKKGYSTGIASLRMEARCATITLIAAALCECTANTVLASVLTPDAFKEAEKEKMPRKWSHLIPAVLKCAPPEKAVIEELWLLKQVRDSIVHAKATVFSPEQAIHIAGNGEHWDHLTPEVARRWVTLPSCVSEIIPPSAGILLYVISSSLRERQPRLPRVHVAEIITALETIEPSQREVIREALERMAKSGTP